MNIHDLLDWEVETDWIRGIAQDEVANLCEFVFRSLENTGEVISTQELREVFREAFKKFGDGSIDLGE